MSNKIQSDFERFKYGLTYFEDLNDNKITIEECHSIFEILKNIIWDEVNKDCIIELVGGFKRGKQTGHDVDILVTHPVLGEETGLLLQIIEALGNGRIQNFRNSEICQKFISN